MSQSAVVGVLMGRSWWTGPEDILGVLGRSWKGPGGSGVLEYGVLRCYTYCV